MKFTKMTKGEYQAVPSCRTDQINANYSAIVRALGEPFKTEDSGYPDDNDKTDVCWGILSPGGDIILIWNYKNGPNYLDEDHHVRDIDGFSVYHTSDDFLNELKKRINGV